MTLPENVTPIAPDEVFQFACHPGLACFTECCRELELALTPYDVLRMRKSLKITSQEFLDRYAIIEFSETPYPMVYLAMVDDGRASCPFVKKEGCQIYADRPGACRTYPLGRGASIKAMGDDAKHIIIHEPHCRGFDEANKQTLKDWQNDQEIALYNKFNDKMLVILNHQTLLNGGKMSLEQADAFIISMYNLDIFREKNTVEQLRSYTDEELLDFAIDWFISNKL